MSALPQTSTLSFTISAPLSATLFGPRTATFSLRRHETLRLNIDTPGILATTSRGVVPHLSRDHHNLTKAIRWVHIPFETFLEHKPPVPTLQQGQTPLHTFLGYSPNQHVTSISVRDPHDVREMPTNGNAFISAYSVRGVRKVSTTEWKSYTLGCRPDFVVPMSDTPFTTPSHSQKRLTKSIERSAAWLLDFLRPLDPSGAGGFPYHVLAHMAGGTSIPARKAFAESLTETLHGVEGDAIAPLQCLDDGLAGYVFDLNPLHMFLDKEGEAPKDNPQADAKDETPNVARAPTRSNKITSLLQASLSVLPNEKLRLANSAQSPHEMLRLIRDVGIDLFDTRWAQEAANIGIALDFTFPVRDVTGRDSQKRRSDKRDLGHNLYDIDYAHDFSPFADSFRGGAVEDRIDLDACPCGACSPVSPPQEILHSSVDVEQEKHTGYLPPFTRAYVHHLLHTHEMSAHTLLAMHNLSVLDAMFAGVRAVIKQSGAEGFGIEVERFLAEYDETLAVSAESRVMWKEIELTRGKGRLAREKTKQEVVDIISK